MTRDKGNDLPDWLENVVAKEEKARRQAVQAVGEVDGVAHAHEQDVHEQEVEPRDGDAAGDGHHRGEDAQVEGVDEGDGDRGLDAEHVDGGQGEGRGDGELPDELGLGGEPERALVGHLRAVVDEPEQPREHRGAQKQPDLGGGGADEQRAGDDGHEHDDAAHGGRALLDQVALGPVCAHLLADVARPEEADPHGHEGHGDHHGYHHGEEHQKRGVCGEHGEHR